MNTRLFPWPILHAPCGLNVLLLQFRVRQLCQLRYISYTVGGRALSPHYVSKIGLTPQYRPMALILSFRDGKYATNHVISVLVYKV
jgi:hypothetical protein